MPKSVSHYGYHLPSTHHVHCHIDLYRPDYDHRQTFAVAFHFALHSPVYPKKCAYISLVISYVPWCFIFYINFIIVSGFPQFTFVFHDFLLLHLRSTLAITTPGFLLLPFFLSAETTRTSLRRNP